MNRQIGQFGQWRGRVLAIALFVASAPAMAGDAWQVRTADADVPAGIVPETRQPAPGGLADGLVAVYPVGDIRSAWYEMPTTRYRHAVLGDGTEAGALAVETATGQTLRLTLPESVVFEDRYPRLADLDGDGSVEVITIRASLTEGAAVTIYGLDDGRLVERASTDFIGRAHRWLNIAGIADFDGRPGLDIAFVRTPHIGGTLFFYGYRGGMLFAIGSLEDFSNHVIGSRELRLSPTADVDGDGRPELALPSHNRRSLRVIGFEDGRPAARAAITLPGRIDKAMAARGGGSDLMFIVGLDDGSVRELAR